MDMRAKKLAGNRTRRLHFALSERSSERLERLATKTDAASSTEVIKDALLTYEALVDRLIEGDSFYIKDRRGNLYPLDLLIDVEQLPCPDDAGGRSDEHRLRIAAGGQ